MVNIYHLVWFILFENICKRVLGLFFDLLHGIQRHNVPLVLVIEFMIFLGYEGKLEANSDMEKVLFLSAIEQLKDRFNFKIAISFCCIFLNL